MFVPTLTVKRPLRQALATLALVAFTMAPTAYVAHTVWRVNRPEHVREVEAELSSVLGLKVSIERVRHPRPGEDVLRGVVLFHQEPRGKQPLELARARAVRLIRGQRTLVLEAEGVLMRAESPRQAMAQAAALLQRAGGASHTRISISAADCQIDLAPGGKTSPLRYHFRDVAGTFEPSAFAPTLTVSYRFSEENSSTRCELSLARNRQGAKVRTTLSFKTMEGVPISARVLDPFFETETWLGSSARVEGALVLSQEGAGDWDAEFQGTITDIDLATLVSQRFPDQRLSGSALVKIQRARWADRPGAQGFGWVSAEGELRAGPGEIGGKLLHALKDEMKFRLPPDFNNHRTDVSFQDLGLSFTLRPDGELLLTGALGTDYPPGTVVVDADHYGPLATAPEGAANVRGLIRTLFPTAEISAKALVPDTAESRILRFLPAPVTTARRSTPIGN